MKYNEKEKGWEDEEIEPRDNYWIAYCVFWIVMGIVLCFAVRGCTEFSIQREKTLQIQSENNKNRQ